VADEPRDDVVVAGRDDSNQREDGSKRDSHPYTVGPAASPLGNGA
jgi:hypothetical protein